MKSVSIKIASYRRIYHLIGGVALLASASSLYGCGGGGGTTRIQTIPLPSTFSAVDGPAGSPTTINGISSLGVLVGFTTNNGVNSNFLDAAGSFAPFSTGDPAEGMGNGVNSHGAVVGAANNNAFLLVNGNQTPITPPNSSSSIAFGINDKGTIVGQFVEFAGGNTPGFVDVNGVFSTINPTASATVTNVQGINNKGIAIGFYSADGVHQHGFTYDVNTKQTTLLADPSTPHITADGLTLTQFLGVNDNNEAVGYYQTTNGSQFGFLYNLSTNTYTFLDAPLAAPVNGVQITQITGVSNGGVVSGFFIDAAAAQHGFVGTPAGSK